MKYRVSTQHLDKEKYMFKDLLIILIFAFLEVGVFLFLMGTFDVHIAQKMSYGSEHKKYRGIL